MLLAVKGAAIKIFIAELSICERPAPGRVDRGSESLIAEIGGLMVRRCWCLSDKYKKPFYSNNKWLMNFAELLQPARGAAEVVGQKIPVIFLHV